MEGFSKVIDEAYKNSGNIVMETVTNIRTVIYFKKYKFLNLS
jgi:hypothetical protein